MIVNRPDRSGGSGLPAPATPSRTGRLRTTAKAPIPSERTVVDLRSKTEQREQMTQPRVRCQET